jgi:hypothetical protein
MYPEDEPKWRDWYFSNYLFEGSSESKGGEEYDIELLAEEEPRAAKREREESEA